MDFNVKLQELRKAKGLTQEELAEDIFVSRTAISKWESGRGYPGIDSLKALATFFGVTVDELLSGDELLVLAQEERKQQAHTFLDVVFGLLDCSVAMFFCLPLFGQTASGRIQAVSLLSLTDIAPYLQAAYVILTVAMIVWGVVTLALQCCRQTVWVKSKRQVSLLLNALGALLCIISSQPYAAIFLFVFLVIKALMLIQWP